MEPSRILWEHSELSFTTTQGLVLWAGLQAQWLLRCDAKYQRQEATLDKFVARWCWNLGTVSAT